MTALTGLYEAVKSSTGPDRELDCRLAVLAHGGEIVWKQANWTMDMHPARKYASKDHVGGFGFDPVPRYTGSLDAAEDFRRAVLPKSLIAVRQDESGAFDVDVFNSGENGNGLHPLETHARLIATLLAYRETLR